MTDGSPLDDASLAVALAMTAGVVCQAFAQRIRLPGIVVLLAMGVALGPDGFNIIRPSALGSGMQVLVGFAVAIILFEGGMALNVRRMLKAGKPIRNLVTYGALVTAVLGTFVAKVFMGWDWAISALFGSLIIVTGPTVITPLLRRFNVETGVGTVLEAEGVLIDAVGAITAAVTLEVALSPSGLSVAKGVISIALRLGVGAALGAAGGFALSWLVTRPRLIPEGLTNVFTLTFVLALFQGSDALFHESGIAAVTVAGVVVGRQEDAVLRELHHFKEQLTILVIGMLFILLAADVRLAEVRSLGRAGVYAVLAVMFLVRPVNVLASTIKTDLNWRQKLFMCWIGPRGIIAAAVASLFAIKLKAAGLEGGTELRALVFTVIASTVLVAGLTGGGVAAMLGLRRKQNRGWLILGAHALARELAGRLRQGGEEIICLEADPHTTEQAERLGFRTLFGNPLEERTLLRAGVDSRRGAIALGKNESANLLFAEALQSTTKLSDVLIALDSLDSGVTEDMASEAGARVLFDAAHAIDLWCVRLRQKNTTTEYWRYAGPPEQQADAELSISAPSLSLPLVRIRGKTVEPIGSGTVFKKGDEVAFLFATDRLDEGRAYARRVGFTPPDGVEDAL